MNKRYFLWAGMILALLLAPAGWGSAGEVSEIQRAIQQQGLNWVAGETSLTQLSPGERKARLGLLPPRLALEGTGIFPQALVPSALPSSLDWRSNGGDYVSYVKDQGNCGSCWAFAAAGALESYTMIQNKTPGAELSLSDQVMVSCCLECSEWQGGCNGGYIHIAAEFARSKGLPKESCYKYSAGDGSCGNACANWQSQAYKIGDWNWVTDPDKPSNVEALKTALYNYGPLMVAFAVYDDFFSYKYGIYSRSVGSRLAGYHAVLIVGYNDKDKLFIVKNSWSTSWGWMGYFNISYDMVTDCHGDLTDPNNSSPGVCFGYESVAYSSTPFPGKATSVSAASYKGLELARDSICSAFGQSMATRTETANTLPLPTSLAGITVKVTDFEKRTQMAPLFFVSPGQVNYHLPATTAPGMASVTVTGGDGTVSKGTIHVAARVNQDFDILGPHVAPGLFSANADGKGVAAANVLRVKADGTQTYEPVARYDDGKKRFVPVPIDLGPESDKVYLILYDTGVRHLSSTAGAKVQVGGISAPVSYAGIQGGYVGLDQVNVLLPRTLAGKGEVDVALTVDAKPANLVKVTVR